MAGFYLNNVLFLITTLIYYFVLKPKFTLNNIESNDITLLKNYEMKRYTSLAIYFIIVVITQFLLNTSIITNNCGGSYNENIGSAFFITFIPWTLLFGAIIVTLTLAPGFKSVFADIIGYFYVSSKANNILSELLLDREISSKIDNVSNVEEKKSLEIAAQAIIKILGSNSLLINQIVPTNFIKYWDLLEPLKKEQFKNQGNGDNAKKIKEDLFQLTVTRDNIGEALWFIYTGILLTALVQLKITNRGCNNNPATMQANYAKFLEEEEKVKEKQEKAKTTYELS